MKQKGFTLTETLIIGALFGVFVLAGTLMLSSERARTRDTKRIADMTRLAAGFALLYSQKGSYVDAAAGCPRVNSNPAACSLTSVIGALDAIKDPGRYHYTIYKVPDQDDFAVKFTLEKSYGSLLAGTHYLNRDGIH